MAQKIIKVGSSAGVTIPKKQLEELGLQVGDEVELTIKPKNKKLQAYAVKLEAFMDEYKEDLESLAKR